MYDVDIFHVDFQYEHPLDVHIKNYLSLTVAIIRNVFQQQLLKRNYVFREN